MPKDKDKDVKIDSKVEKERIESAKERGLDTEGMEE